MLHTCGPTSSRLGVANPTLRLAFKGTRKRSVSSVIPPRRICASAGNGAASSKGASENSSSDSSKTSEHDSSVSLRSAASAKEAEKGSSNKDLELERSNSHGSHHWESLRENASKAFYQEGDDQDDELSADAQRSLKSSTKSAPLKRGIQFWRSQFRQWTARASYHYYNWRRDSWQDVQLFVALNLVLLVLGGLIKGAIVDALDGAIGETGFEHFWQDVYGVLVVVFGQELPDAGASIVDQTFALLVAFVGLATFALVLALVEQVVLENLEDNVRTGSAVFEEDHFLVLGWCNNQRDEEVIWKILSQICRAYKADGGRTVVVLSSRPKVQMENTFRRIIPDEQRFGTTFVFRAGSPLVPSDLRRVAASKAAAVIVVADSSRSAEEADAQSLRAAVLLDELDFPGFDLPDPRSGHILVELKTANAVKLVQYSTSNRVIAVPTTQLNARRISRMVRNPVVGSIDSMLLSFNSHSQFAVADVPKMAGKSFGELFKWFPDGIPFGLVNQSSANVMLNPPPSTFVNSGDSLLLLKPNGLQHSVYASSKLPVEVDLGEWDPTKYLRASVDECPMGKDSSYTSKKAMTGGQPPNLAGKARSRRIGRAKARRTSKRRSLQGGTSQSGMFMLPVQYTNAEKILILGWGDVSFMTMLLRELDRGPAALPRGSELTLYNSREGLLGKIRDRAKLESLSILHVQGNPLDQEELKAKVDLARFKCVIVICDQAWLDPDLDARNGILMANEEDMLRLDSMIMMVQLNVRAILEASGSPEVNIICEKVAFEGVTRFEDRYRLPLGISVNMSAFGATFLAEAAYDPRILLPYSHMGESQELTIQDISAFVDEGEDLSFWELQARVSAIGQVLYGTYALPEVPDQPINIIVNPCGDKARSRKGLWNSGKCMHKVITLAPKLVVERGVSSSITSSAITPEPSEKNTELQTTDVTA